MIYDDEESIPEDLIRKITTSGDIPPPIDKAKFGIDSCLGLVASSIAAPLYLYSTLKGKFQVWDDILDGLDKETIQGPVLDVGCGRGLVLLKVAQRKKKLASQIDSTSVAAAYGIDVFRTSDQSGNSPAATYQNAAAMGVLDHTVLHTADFTKKLPFADNVFSLIVTCLAVHNVDREGRRNAVSEMARVCKPAGKLVFIDLYGYFKEHQQLLESLNWVEVDVSFVGLRMSYGLLPCQVLTAQKPGLP